MAWGLKGIQENNLEHSANPSALRVVEQIAEHDLERAPDQSERPTHH